MFLRNKIMGVAAAAHYIVNVAGESVFNSTACVVLLTSCSLVTEAGPSAFANIKENYYYVFVGCCSVYLVLIYLYFP